MKFYYARIPNVTGQAKLIIGDDEWSAIIKIDTSATNEFWYLDEDSPEVKRRTRRLARKLGCPEALLTSTSNCRN